MMAFSGNGPWHALRCRRCFEVSASTHALGRNTDVRATSWVGMQVNMLLSPHLITVLALVRMYTQLPSFRSLGGTPDRHYAKGRNCFRHEYDLDTDVQLTHLLDKSSTAPRKLDTNVPLAHDASSCQRVSRRH